MDEIIRAVSKDGFAKISVVTARDAVQRANAIHHCSPTAIAALGRSLCAASMLGDLLKEENGTLTLRISGGGGLGSIIAVSDSEGNVRGMVSNPAFDLPTRPDGKLDVGGAVGKDGMLGIRSNGKRTTTRLLDAEFPKFRQLLPAEHTAVATIGVAELAEAIKGGDSEYFREPARLTGEGTGFWEAPRGALYHSEKVVDGKIEGYQIIIPSTWNLAPINGDGEHGPLEQALIGVPVADIEKPINALRTVHSFDPCTACAVHVTERGTGKHFETVTSPWGVK